MRNYKLIIAFLLIGFGIILTTSLSILESLSISFLCVYLYNFINSFGKSIWVVLDLIVLLAVITWLVVPLFFYHYYNEDNDLANTWVKTMQVDSDTYYAFVFPATLALALGIHWPFGEKLKFNYSLGYLRKMGAFDRPKKLAYQLIGLSLMASFIAPFTPEALKYILYLLDKLFLLGLFYLFFSGNRPKLYLLFIGAGILILNSIRSGMFGELIFMIAIALIILSLGVNYSFYRKLSIILLGAFMIILLQSIKGDYRKVAWSTGDDATFFSTLVVNRLINPSTILDKDVLFGIAVRFNQGWLIAGTMSNVPDKVPFANGETIWQSIAAIIIPRLVWPDKPISGGKANLERFLQIKDIGYSMNLGPIGEAYANFGLLGGVIFMFLYGLFFKWVFNVLIKITYSYPTIIFWIPLLFFYAVSVETDMLTTINSLIKTAVFVWILWKIYPIIFKMSL